MTWLLHWNIYKKCIKLNLFHGVISEKEYTGICQFQIQINSGKLSISLSVSWKLLYRRMRRLFRGNFNPIYPGLFFVPGARFSKEDPITFRALKAIFNDLYLKRKQCIGFELCMEVNLFVLKLCEKNSSVNVEFKIFAHSPTFINSALKL